MDWGPGGLGSQLDVYWDPGGIWTGSRLDVYWDPGGIWTGIPVDVYWDPSGIWWDLDWDPGECGLGSLPNIPVG